MKRYFVNGTYSSFEEYVGLMRRWNVDCRKLDKGPFHGNLGLIDSGLVQVSWFMFDGIIERYGMTPKGYVTLILPGDTNQTYKWFHKDLDSKFLGKFPGSNELDMLSATRFNTIGVSIKESHLDKLIDYYKFSEAKALLAQQEIVFELSLIELRMLATFVHSLLSSINTGNKAMVSSLFWYKVEYTLPYMILELIEKSYSVDANKLVAKKDYALQESIKYINRNLHHKISISELCTKYAISQKSLEEAFKQHYGITPGSYIKRTRLNLVRNQLVKPDNRESITSISKRFGFNHSGQFSADYLHHFGLLPSETKENGTGSR